MAVAEFIVGPLLDNPYRVGHLLRDEYAGQYSAAARRSPVNGRPQRESNGKAKISIFQ